MGQVCLKFGGRWWPVRQAGRRNVMVAKREERRECDKNKKNDQKKKRSATQKNTTKNHFGPRETCPRPLGLPFGSQVRPN
jgi:hypothetical protein